MPLTGNLFPNTSWHGRQPRALCVWHPHGVGETEAWRFFLVDADAPAAVKDVLRRYYMRYSGPAGMTEQDDMENWLYATRSSQVTIAVRNIRSTIRRRWALIRWTIRSPAWSRPRSPIRRRAIITGYSRYLKGDAWDSLLGRDLAPLRAAAE